MSLHQSSMYPKLPMAGAGHITPTSAPDRSDCCAMTNETSKFFEINRIFTPIFCSVCYK